MSRVFRIGLGTVLIGLVIISHENSTKVDLELRSKSKIIESPRMDHPELFAEMERSLRTPDDRNRPEYGPNHLVKELKKARQSSANARLLNDLVFDDRGPGNVAGRTRALAVDPADESNNTWFAGSASGGIWRTTDAGQSWVNVSGDLPNLSVGTLGISKSNPDVIYAGTGEHFTGEVDGSGLFKSTDKGVTWSQIGDPSEYYDMRNVTRLIVDPENENNVVLTSTNSVWSSEFIGSIYRTEDGGQNWTRTHTDQATFDQIIANPLNFKTQYVSVNGTGVLKSKDGGQTWNSANTGITDVNRIEMAISAVDTSRVWISTGAGNSSRLLFTDNGGDTWSATSEIEDGPLINFLEAQHWYNNTITTHPFNKDIVYVGGINLWEIDLQEGSVFEETLSIDLGESSSFMELVAFDGSEFQGLDLGEGFDSLVSVEIRFGQGTQLAHRFTVDQRGSGVPPEDYEYNDYVEVPFQAWDVTNNIQLMVSFRDQQEDSTWNLIEFNTTGASSEHSREYVFVHQEVYNDTASIDISEDGGHEVGMLYNYWPNSPAGSEFDAANLPVSSFDISKVLLENRLRSSTNLSDAYFDHGGLNSFSNTQFINQEGVHPDQHGLQTVVGSSEDETFKLLVTNDGGIYQTKLSSSPGVQESDFLYSGFGYNTSQFYGADKAPGEDRYIGGMQDNSTWFTASGETASSTSEYLFAFGGDGFEALWNNRDGNLIIGSIQFNQFGRTEDGGITWVNGTTGMSDVGDGTSPFRSRLANSKLRPDRIYTVGSSGVWYSTNFGAQWNVTEIDSDFWFFGGADVEVSNADWNVVWAGQGISEDQRLFVSRDAGESFDPTNNYDGTTLGRSSGFKPHPIDTSTAFALFSFAGRPKVLKTEDFGQTWTDISGFEGNEGSSDRGFPDVAVNSIQVFPNDPNRIWVGSEIGIIESLDAGASWALLTSNFPAVSVHDFKIADDQIVIATHGRGIWSVTIPDIEQEIIFPPVISSLGIAPDGDMIVNVDFGSKFDSVEFAVSNNLIHSVYETSAESEKLSLPNPNITGSRKIKSIGYIDGIAYESDETEFTFFVPEEPSESFFSDFSIITNDFVFENMRFSNSSLQTDHPYETLTDYYSILTTPITIGSNSIMTYRDIAIVETGELNTVFGDFEFWDYVIVEGTTDGINWKGLLDGYDASFDEEWRQTYRQNLDVTDDLYRDQQLNLADSFNVDDTILIRFRLFSDPGAVGWGWAIDDLQIGDRVLSTSPVSSIDLKISPNPVYKSGKIEYNLFDQSGSISLMGIDGRNYRSWEVDGKGVLEFDRTTLKPGVYILKMNSSSGTLTKKLVLD